MSEHIPSYEDIEARDLGNLAMSQQVEAALKSPRQIQRELDAEIDRKYEEELQQQAKADYDAAMRVRARRGL